MLQNLLRVKHALVIYSMFIVAVMILGVYALVGQPTSHAQSFGWCSGQCESGSTCNQYGNPDSGKMWACLLNPGSTTQYGCYQVDTNAGGNHCYLDCQNGWSACGCDVNACQARCLVEHANDTPGTYNRTELCTNCQQEFSCSCKITPTPVITTPPVTTPPVTTPPVTTPPVTTPPVTTVVPQCPPQVNAQFWYYLPNELANCQGDPRPGCGGLTGWISGTDLSARNPNRPFYLDVNCFQQNGAAPLSSPRTELYRNGVRILSANDFGLRDFLINDIANYSARCIFTANNTISLLCDQDSFTPAQVPTTPQVTTPPVTTPPVTTPPVTTPPPQTPGLQIIKEAINDPGAYGLGQPVIFRIRITNTGQTLITRINFRDMYNINYLDFIRVVDPISGQNITSLFNVDENLGVITHPDLTTIYGDFWPGRTVAIQFEFVTRQAIDTTCNDVFVNPGFEDFEARDCVRIVAPLPTTDL